MRSTHTQRQNISVSLSQEAHCWAGKFAAEQDTPQKGKQVYLNTLAVYAVHKYLKWLQIETDLTQSDCWQPGLRSLFDIADLILPNIGTLECRPLLPDEVILNLPWVVTQNLIGYVAVEFHWQLDSVQLLGFLPPISSEQLPQKLSVTQLQSLDTLIDTIYNSRLVNLRQWLEGIFDKDWQPTGLVLANNFRNTSSPTNSTCRAKVIYLGEQQLILVIKLSPTEGKNVDISLRLYPGNNAVYLPKNLHLILFDQAGNSCMQAQARNTDNWIELLFSCQQDEKFSVEIVLEKMRLMEKFLV